MLTSVASAMLLSSDQVPSGWLYVPYPIISVTGSTFLSSPEVNSTGTPIASPTTKPYIPDFQILSINSPPTPDNNNILHIYLKNGIHPLRLKVRSILLR